MNLTQYFFQKPTEVQTVKTLEENSFINCFGLRHC